MRFVGRRSSAYESTYDLSRLPGEENCADAEVAWARHEAVSLLPLRSALSETAGRMSDNPCLRPACYGDVQHDALRDVLRIENSEQHIAYMMRNRALMELYHAEWKKRGFERSP